MTKLGNNLCDLRIDRVAVSVVNEVVIGLGYRRSSHFHGLHGLAGAGLIGTGRRQPCAMSYEVLANSRATHDAVPTPVMAP